MRVKDIEIAIAKLSPQELADLAAWFADYHAQAWDAQIERDLDTGRLDALLAALETEYKAGGVKPL